MSEIKVGSESVTSAIDIDLNAINDESQIRNTFQTFKSILFRVIECKLGKVSFLVIEHKKRMFFANVILLLLLSKVNETIRDVKLGNPYTVNQIVSSFGLYY
jgi:hypothetical protein